MAIEIHEGKPGEGMTLKAPGHTPGPWRYDDKSGDSGGLVVWAEGGDRVARVCWDSCDEQSEALSETEPNARLIAAAPELLAELIKMTEYAERLGARPWSAWAVIAKATRR